MYSKRRADQKLTDEPVAKRLTQHLTNLALENKVSYQETAEIKQREWRPRCPRHLRIRTRPGICAGEASRVLNGLLSIGPMSVSGTTNSNRTSQLPCLSCCHMRLLRACFCMRRTLTSCLSMTIWITKPASIFNTSRTCAA